MVHLLQLNHWWGHVVWTVNCIHHEHIVIVHCHSHNPIAWHPSLLHQHPTHVIIATTATSQLGLMLTRNNRSKIIVYMVSVELVYSGILILNKLFLWTACASNSASTKPLPPNRSSIRATIRRLDTTISLPPWRPSTRVFSASSLLFVPRKVRLFVSPPA